MDDKQRLRRAAREQRVAHLREESAMLRQMLDALRARQREEESPNPPAKKVTA